MTIVHGPRSCAHIFASSMDLVEMKRADRSTLASSRLRCTDMDDSVSVFGGLDLLRDRILDEINSGRRYIFVVTACVSGIIGDNVPDLVEAIGREHPEVFIRAVMADGNILGEWDKGYVASAEELLTLVDDRVRPENGYVNLIGERYFYRQERDMSEAAELFEMFGLEVNCHLMYRTSVDDIRNFRRADLTAIVEVDKVSMALAAMVENRLDIRVERDLIPTGIRSFERFAERIGEITGDPGPAIEVAAKVRNEYDRSMSLYRRRTAGKRVIVISKFTEDIDWLLELLADLGMDVLKVGIGVKHIWAQEVKVSAYRDDYRFQKDYELEDLRRDLDELAPDAVVSDSGNLYLEECRCLIYSRPGPGVRGTLAHARRLYDLMVLPEVPGWRCIE